MFHIDYDHDYDHITSPSSSSSLLALIYVLVWLPSSHNPLDTVSQTPDAALKNVPKEHIRRVHEHPASVE